MENLSDPVETGVTNCPHHLLTNCPLFLSETDDQVRKAGFITTNQFQEHITKESQAVMNSLRSEMESMREKVSSDSAKNSGIERLEEQFCILKNKYDRQMEKLEAENLKLREALHSQHQIVSARSDPPPILSLPDGLACENNKDRTVSAYNKNIPEKDVYRVDSFEICKVPRNSPCSGLYSSLENIPSTSTVKEAFSQTEKELRNISIQCLYKEKSEEEDENPQREETTCQTNNFDAKKIENKENLLQKRKANRWSKPFADVNAYHLGNKKKSFSDYETRLMVTLRGLQAELSAKDKETRKLKTEIDLLKTQAKRFGKNKVVEVSRKFHVGTQTIGFGPLGQKPYDPELFQASSVYEKENEELKSKIRTLEENLEVLKEKRIKDLQALHQVHEEEMAKLVSKLETQSALTKHLHSLLVNR